MSVNKRTGVTAEAVSAELADLEAKYKVDRATALAVVTEPYRERRKKLTRLLEVLQDEEGQTDAE